MRAAGCYAILGAFCFVVAAACFFRGRLLAGGVIAAVAWTCLLLSTKHRKAVR